MSRLTPVSASFPPTAMSPLEAAAPVSALAPALSFHLARPLRGRRLLLVLFASLSLRVRASLSTLRSHTAVRRSGSTGTIKSCTDCAVSSGWLGGEIVG